MSCGHLQEREADAAGVAERGRRAKAELFARSGWDDFREALQVGGVGLLCLNASGSDDGALGITLVLVGLASMCCGTLCAVRACARAGTRAAKREDRS